ncbi:4Fe-4S binding protein [Treponema succinifaciens]|uniref:4Fe-4S binding protein n=1 Tax=Treponema succinifaciens TaxID=167 RepID=UPI003FF111BE
MTEFFPMTTIPGLIAGIIFIGLFLGLVVVLPILTKRRTQCSMLCPFGAFASLTDKLSPFKMRIDTEKCKGCMKCAQACLFGAIDVATIQQKKDSPEITCAKCGECVAACPEKAISYQFRFNKGCCAPVPKTKLAKGIQKFFAPENLFRFAAFTFGAIMSSAFTINSIEIIL